MCGQNDSSPFFLCLYYVPYRSEQVNMHVDNIENVDITSWCQGQVQWWVRPCQIRQSDIMLTCWDVTMKFESVRVTSWWRHNTSDVLTKWDIWGYRWAISRSKVFFSFHLTVLSLPCHSILIVPQTPIYVPVLFLDLINVDRCRQWLTASCNSETTGVLLSLR